MANVQAKRGDLVVVQTHHRDYVLRGESREYDEFTVGVVTSVTRDGQVRMFRRAGNFDQGKDWRGQPDRGEELRPGSFVRALVMPATKIAVNAALAVAACHVWDGHESQARAYDSLEEVRAALRPCAALGTGIPTELGEAAQAWEAARRKTGPMLRAALDVAYSDHAAFLRMSAEYDAAVTAANDAFRAVYAQVCGELAAA